MKPLTIDELKSLEVGVWGVGYTPDKRYGAYARVCQTFDDDAFRVETMESYIPYSYFDYGKMWITYKNKEQAEEARKQSSE